MFNMILLFFLTQQLLLQLRTGRSDHTPCLYTPTKRQPSATSVDRCCLDLYDKDLNVTVGFGSYCCTQPGLLQSMGDSHIDIV